MNKKFEITFRFNLILIVYFFINQAVLQIFEPETQDKVLWDIFFESYPTTSIIVAIILYFLILICGAKLLQIIWGSFLSDIFKVRIISFQESLTLAIILSFFSV